MAASCDLGLDPNPMTFIYGRDLYPLKMDMYSKNELLRSKLSKIRLHSDRQTDTNL